MSNRNAIILAAGKGTRMKSKLYKVLHQVAGKAMVDHVLTTISQAGFDNVISIVGYGAEEVKSVLGERSDYCLQAEQLGTGHAVLQAEDKLKDKDGVTLVICGDTPLLTAETIKELVARHEEEEAKATVLTAFAQDPTAYGRVLRDEQGFVQKIVEEKDANEAEKAVQEINTGTYVFDNKALFDALHQVGNDNAQGEYYLPDVISILQNQGQRISAYQMADLDESLGVNDRVALAKASQLFFRRNNIKHMRNGVTIVDPDNTYIEADVEIGPDTIIEPNVHLKGQTVLGSNVYIASGSVIIDSQIGDGVKVRSSEIEASKIAEGADVGPNAHLRPKSEIGPHAHIGNFVETKNARIGQGTKVGHLTYIGDAELGKNINVSCGVIFANYDGANKAKTVVGDNSFIGSNVNLVAPVSVADNAFIAAGSTINKDVPSQAMAIARARQENKENYWEKLAISKK
ncbi:bifunctional UDP-N-acetylglucosamine diphosphorylase/glucosamine-1-phosphate N-acetyltransferase GlmU [Aerococcus kribbianus]|uniref:Bifunctional protein GlmU n=1 Tax=Aerococcus kribbianus TaxID=2999064 RepID=A0A9X3FTN1_9LACT|nr:MULTISPECIES: bifunctional UDP-N-acetylglucosamine diphosphorylase/glucosamine-1-phosphate N-acetyltransferase GlmU [unclassified Aerococcus]MCZ0718031.1 bifunctional UDP-N-acetylglucosamine diphosphorylase/glucosamine-1-phosphate N-acetyltransferase GlmU [Aerococcus sp. YH-aer221]MCZ0726400.1 bifunctional UDP-N-acetylglucosamine diphosphorylase/glucosamine-1-phosphate N-acetyltransferase GlmU [Aerococcus sp. YH-aer222]